MRGYPAVLLYHVIASRPADADSEERNLMVEPKEFEWQMADLAARGYRTMTLDQFWGVLEGASGGEQAVLLTFDDAYAGVDRVVTPVLRRYGFSAVMFAPFGHLGGRNTWDAEHTHLASLPIATADELRSMAAGPWEIASHSTHHVELTSLTPARCLEDLVTSRERLSEALGRPVRDLAYPHGAEDAAVRRIAREAGYRMAFTAGRTPSADRFALDRRPINGADSRAVFRMKTSRSAELLYGVAGLAPAWARSAARRLTATATAGKP